MAVIILNSKEDLQIKDIFIDFKRRYESSSKMNTKILFILIQFYLKSLIKKLPSNNFLAISSIARSLFLISL